MAPLFASQGGGSVKGFGRKFGGPSFIPFSQNFDYTNNVQSLTIPYTGTYDLEVWGAAGGDDPQGTFGGRGGYSKGRINLDAGTQIYIHVGGKGSNGDTRSSWWSSGGGGATDIRLASGAWNTSAGYLSRIIVAGGGGGRHGKNYEGVSYVGNDGGGLSAPSFTANSTTITGASQTDGGNTTYSTKVIGSFGFANWIGQSNSYSTGGYNGGAAGADNWACGGPGGGWYGGTASWPTGGGGSGYVLTSTSHKPSGYTPGSNFWMTNTSSIAGNSTMPNPSGGTMTGKSGNGYARITRIEV